MERNVINQLIEWKNKKNRKPQILNGARQVGKTYILQEFGKKCYEKVAYVICDKNHLSSRSVHSSASILRSKACASP